MTWRRSRFEEGNVNSPGPRDLYEKGVITVPGCILVHRVGGILEGRLQSDQVRAVVAMSAKEVVQHRSVEGIRVEEQDVLDLPLEELCR